MNEREMNPLANLKKYNSNCLNLFIRSTKCVLFGCSYKPFPFKF